MLHELFFPGQESITQDHVSFSCIVLVTLTDISYTLPVPLAFQSLLMFGDMHVLICSDVLIPEH
jgi:hypothetical protein